MVEFALDVQDFPEAIPLLGRALQRNKTVVGLSIWKRPCYYRPKRPNEPVDELARGLGIDTTLEVFDFPYDADLRAPLTRALQGNTTMNKLRLWEESIQGCPRGKTGQTKWNCCRGQGKEEAT